MFERHAPALTEGAGVFGRVPFRSSWDALTGGNSEFNTAAQLLLFFSSHQIISQERFETNPIYLY